jgi:hypothetical protein
MQTHPKPTPPTPGKSHVGEWPQPQRSGMAGPRLPASQIRPDRSLLPCNTVPRPSIVNTASTRNLALISITPNAPAQARRADDVRVATRAPNRRCLQSAGWAMNGRRSPDATRIPRRHETPCNLRSMSSCANTRSTPDSMPRLCPKFLDPRKPENVATDGVPRNGPSAPAQARRAYRDRIYRDAQPALPCSGLVGLFVSHASIRIAAQ